MSPALGLLALVPDLVILVLVAAFGREVLVMLNRYRAAIIAAVLGAVAAILVVEIVLASCSLRMSV